jgi:hypothetical protein
MEIETMGFLYLGTLWAKGKLAKRGYLTLSISDRSDKIRGSDSPSFTTLKAEFI